MRTAPSSARRPPQGTAKAARGGVSESLDGPGRPPSELKLFRDIKRAMRRSAATTKRWNELLDAQFMVVDAMELQQHRLRLLRRAKAIVTGAVERD